MTKPKFKLVLQLILVFVILAPWFLTDSEQTISAAKVTSDLSFYEINTCKISVFDFLSNNINTIYQDHYSFTLNNYSSVNCFGKIAGLTQVGQEFYIAIGTNSLISTLIQGIFFILCISFIKPKNNGFVPREVKHILSLGLSSSLFGMLVFAEIRFYEKSFYMLDLSLIKSYLLIILIFFFLNKKVIDLLNKRLSNITNYIPYMFLLVGSFTGLNANFYILIFSYYGIYSLLEKRYNYKYLMAVVTLISFWGVNAISDNYSFKPDKLRGFTSSFYGYRSVMAWGIIFFLLILGMYFVFTKSVNYFDLRSFQKNIIFSSILILFTGYASAANPFIKFLSYFYFGQEKMGTTEANVFRIDEWSEKIAWRGYFSSAETAGEFYGLAILFYLLLISNTASKKFRDVVYCFIPVFGIYLSNNRTVFILLFVGLVVYFLKNSSIQSKYKYITILSTLTLAVLFVGVDKFTYEYSYQSIFIQANMNSLDYTTSTYLNLLNSKYGTNSIFTFIFSFLTFIGYILNRSELWGLYFARYNPNYFEYLFGGGPFNFGQLYSEVNIRETESLLFPHSSILSGILFFGLVGIGVLFFGLLKQIIKNKENLDFVKIFLICYIVINLAKSDSLNYMHAFTMYYFLFFLIFNTKKNFFYGNNY